MRRVILSLSLVLTGIALPLAGGCLAIGGKNEAKPDHSGAVKVEKETKTITKTEVESSRP